MTSSVITIDQTRALSLLTRAVQERGDGYVYEPPVRPSSGNEACLYLDPDSRTPSCGVALALSYLEEVTPEVLEEMDGGMLDDSGIGEDRVHEILSTSGVALDLGATAVFVAFQESQDQSWSWGQALIRAQRVRQS